MDKLHFQPMLEAMAERPPCTHDYKQCPCDKALWLGEARADNAFRSALTPPPAKRTLNAKTASQLLAALGEYPCDDCSDGYGCPCQEATDELGAVAAVFRDRLLENSANEFLDAEFWGDTFRLDGIIKRMEYALTVDRLVGEHLGQISRHTGALKMMLAEAHAQTWNSTA
jgi:hypothetical protein